MMTMMMTEMKIEKMSIAYSCMTYVAVLIIDRYIAPRVSARFVTAYRTLSEENRVRWNNQLTSLGFSIVYSALIGYCLITEEEIVRDPVWGQSRLVAPLSGLVIGYMLADITILTLIEPAVLYRPLYVGHHVLLTVPAVTLMVSGCCTYLYLLRSLSEFSNIFLHLRWHFKHTYLHKPSVVSTVNDILFSITFTASRILILPYYYLSIMPIFWATSLPTYIVIITILCGLLFDVLNAYWFCCILQMMVKRLFLGKKGNQELCKEPRSNDVESKPA